MFNLIRLTVVFSFIIFLTACGASGVKVEKKPNEVVPTPQSVSKKPKIIAFGDSLSAGFGLQEKESYPYLLQEKLKADGYDYEVVNAGISGDTTAGGLDRIDWSLEQENVQILILELGANDLLRGLSPTQMKKNLDEIITVAKMKKVTVLLCGMLAPPTMGTKYQAEFVTVFPELAKKHNVAYLPFLLKDVATKPELNQADGIHPNAEGEKIMTENVYKALVPLLKKN
jgi:acyl-CoA thioesterase I